MISKINIIEYVDAMPEHLGHAELVDAWNNLAKTLDLDPDEGVDIIVAAARDISLKSNGRIEPAWGGAWQWNLSDGAAKAAVVSLLVVGALVAAGASVGMAPVVIPTIIPFLFDVKKIQLERTEDKYLRIIGARAEIVNRIGNFSELYESLPTDVKDSLSKHEFESLLFKAEESGRALTYGEVFEVLPNGEAVFKISIK